MTDFFFRTEDIRPEDIFDFFAEGKEDRNIVDALKNRNPTILVGSRGVGKSFLLRVAQNELLQAFPSERIFPVYMSFIGSALLQSNDPEQFSHWMLARICSSVTRALKSQGLLASHSQSAKILTGESDSLTSPTSIEKIISAYENSWKNPDVKIDTSLLPSVDNVKEALEDIATELNIKRFNLFIDEAAHIFAPDQQRQFFTLFRDLRSHCITCKAAVYPGVTVFGDTFQPSHDATLISLHRDVLAPEYVDKMREIVEKQADSAMLQKMAENMKNFAILAYAASGNPRLLLKTLSEAPKLNSTQINSVIKDYYRVNIWSEHTALADKYAGHTDYIDWGRDFIETVALPEIKSKNDVSLNLDRSTSAYIWVHRDAPEAVKESLRILSYTGILSEHTAGIKATRAAVGSRYVVNLGCLFALEPAPAATAFDVAKGLSPRRMTEYGAKHTAYEELLKKVNLSSKKSLPSALEVQFKKPSGILDLTNWQKEKLIELNLKTVGEVFQATEEKLKQASYVGDVRARQMRNAAFAAVMEYLSG